MKILSPVVDRFVISESTVTFSGERKPLFFLENRNLFREFERKILHNVVDDTPEGDPFERDNFQKCAVARGLRGCPEDTVIIFGDVDEIPNPKKIPEILKVFKDDKIYHFAQRMFLFYLNLEETSGNLLSFSGEFDGIGKRQWLGTKMFHSSMMNRYTLGELRFPERKSCGIRVADGGWHFSYMGGDKSVELSERIAYKIKSAAHQEFNTEDVLSSISKNVAKRRDIFGRKSKFTRVEIDSSFPDYLVENPREYSHLILVNRSLTEMLGWRKSSGK